ncbi:MAG: FAD-dependent oxidoreductase [Cyanobacteria bacterium HKST-UBA02]|nr:FAD-dependent oxidoreductase [Cyanobacteria bacterium HKST-UBA02]
MSERVEVAIVGGGLAGLCCARTLANRNIPCLVLEASDQVGGRVRTDLVDGFLLDRGFQIFLTAYPEARAVLNYEALSFRPFAPGAIVAAGGGAFHKLSDPWKRPLAALETFMAPVGNPADKVKVGVLRTRARMMTVEQIFAQKNDCSTEAHLEQEGFSTSMIEMFFRPFFRGIFLDDSLETSRRMFDFVFAMLASGDNVLPANGMGDIPRQIAEALPEGTVRLGAPVASVKPNLIRLVTGEEIACDRVVLATEEPVTRKLLGLAGKSTGRAQTTVYFACNDEPPFREPMIVINGEGKGIVNNLSIQSNVAPTYAPPGRSLVAASCVGDVALSDDALLAAVRSQLAGWYGAAAVNSWSHLRTYRIEYSLPDQSPGALDRRRAALSEVRGISVCGDFLENGSINGAMVSGRKAAEALIGELAAVS